MAKFTYQKFLSGFLSNGVTNITKMCSTYLKKAKGIPISLIFLLVLTNCAANKQGPREQSLLQRGCEQARAKLVAHAAPPGASGALEAEDLLQRIKF